MNRKMLLGVLSGGVIAASVLFCGLGVLARQEAQTPAEALHGKSEAQDARLIEIQNKFALKQLDELRNEMVNYARQRRQKEVELRIKRERLKVIDDMPIPPDQVKAVLDKDPHIIGLRKEMADTDEVLKQVARVAKDGKDSAPYKVLKRQLDDLAIGLGKREDEMRPDAIDEIRNGRQGALQSEIAQLENNITLLKVLEDTFIEKTRTLARQEKEATRPDPKLLNMEQKLDRILDRLEKIEKRLDKLEPKR
jgi:hypothetical protein